ncbi:hypothetical protein [Limnobacter sp.]|uniref:hypothetical protein n=1 Tax=Limnobacter sp. TaxID=2003368 RepID=UPI0025C46211|nr:hypothetical protein [Limnobacter sp.]
MNAQEYLDLARKEERERRNNPNQYDLYSYTYVWLKSRRPDLAKELTEQFQEIELQVNAAREVEHVLQLEQLYDNRWEDLHDDDIPGL